MEMTIDEAIKQLTTYSIPCGKYKDAYDMAISTMRKYQKIEQILQEQCIIPEGCYPKLKKIKEVVEDGKID